MRAKKGFRLTIELGNDAMRTRRDVASTLEDLARVIREERERDGAKILDVNGNAVGSWEFE